MYLFQQLNKAGKHIDFNSVKDANNWYRREALKVNKADIDRNKIMDTAKAFRTFTELRDPQSLGKMFIYQYDPKLKDILPFYDTFPLVFPIGFYKDGFLGINLHYLAPRERAVLMNAIYEHTQNQAVKAKDKPALIYNTLSSAPHLFKKYNVCVKRYLANHVINSRYQYINPNDWDKALMLPMQKWVVNSHIRSKTPVPTW